MCKSLICLDSVALSNIKKKQAGKQAEQSTAAKEVDRQVPILPVG
jgi:hypothetical protein